MIHMNVEVNFESTTQHRVQASSDCGFWAVQQKNIDSIIWRSHVQIPVIPEPSVPRSLGSKIGHALWLDGLRRLSQSQQY